MSDETYRSTRFGFNNMGPRAPMGEILILVTE